MAIDNHTPSISETSIAYDLGSIKAQIISMKDSMNDNFKQLNVKIDQDRIYFAGELAKLGVKVDHSEIEIQRIKDWKNIITAKITAVFAVVTGFWILFGKIIEKTVGGVFS